MIGVEATGVGKVERRIRIGGRRTCVVERGREGTSRFEQSPNPGRRKVGRRDGIDEGEEDEMLTGNIGKKEEFVQYASSNRMRKMRTKQT